MPAGSWEADAVTPGKGDPEVAQVSVYFLTGTEVLYVNI